MMRDGDIIEWRGLNRCHRGRVTISENGELRVMMDDGHTFSLNDLLPSKSLKVVEA